MSLSAEQLQRILTQARLRESQGYFARVKAGDQRAASLFARLIAFDLNASGNPEDCGWLSKSPGESQVDGYAEDAICGNADPNDLQNVIDLVNGAGAPGASLPSRLLPSDLKPRRVNNRWVKPQPLVVEETSYLLSGGQPMPPPPPAQPVYPSYEALGGDEGGKKITRMLEADYKRAGARGLDGDCGAWQQRVSYDFLTGICKTVEEAIAKHRRSWCQTLGIDVE